MQDAALNGAKQMDIAIDHKALYTQCPPRRTKHTMVAEIEAAPCIKQAVEFKYENYHHSTGGLVHTLLQVRTGGPRFVIGTVEGRTETECAFIYDLTGILPGPYRAHMGILIDNGIYRGDLLEKITNGDLWVLRTCAAASRRLRPPPPTR